MDVIMGGNNSLLRVTKYEAMCLRAESAGLACHMGEAFWKAATWKKNRGHGD